MPATGALSGTPASIIASEPPQTDAIDDEPFDSRMSETTRIGVGELVLARHHRRERALGERAVADLAAARAAQERDLADRERREVVVQHEALVALAVDASRSSAASSAVPSVQVTSACVSPRVNTAEPCARGSTPASLQIGADLVELAAVEAHAVLEHLVAEHLLLELLEDALGLDLALRPRPRGCDATSSSSTSSTRS